MKSIYQVLLLCLLSFLLSCKPAPSEKTEQGFASLGQASLQYAQAKRGDQVQLPQDLGSHPDYRIEWWYFTANLQSESGEQYGIQWTLFRQSLVPEKDFNSINWAVNEVWMAHTALTTPENHYFEERIARGGAGQAGVKSHPFSAWLDDWALLQSEQPKHWKYKGTTQGNRIELELSIDNAAVFHGENGFSAKSSSGEGSMYFSYPYIDIKGELEVAGNKVRVIGKGWLDREWSSQFLKEDQAGWDWFALHLDHGAKLMVFQLRGAESYRSGTYLDPQGSYKALDGQELILKPTQIRQTEHGEVPVQWLVKIPELSINIEVSSSPIDNWNSGLFKYWEGPVQAVGSQGEQRLKGMGYLEMTGYYNNAAPQ